MAAKDVGEQALTRALFWYDMCLAQVQETVQASMPGYMRIVVGVMNNMAIASYDLSHFPKVRQIFGTLMELVLPDSSDERLQNFQEKEMEGLLSNIISVHAVAIAPAA